MPHFSQWPDRNRAFATPGGAEEYDERKEVETFCTELETRAKILYLNRS
jgi:hypothetical protein